MRTSSKNFNTYLESHSVDYDEDTPLVQLNARVKGTQPYYEPFELNTMLVDYIKSKIDGNSLMTENGNNLQAMRIQNALYIDIDYYFNATVKDSEYENVCSDIAMYAKELYEDEVKCDKVSFVFLPATFQNAKGGAHIMMFSEKNISIDERRVIYANIKDRMLSYILENHPHEILTKVGGEFVEFDDTNYENVFDSSPLFNITTLLPFAQKDSKSRNYVLNLDCSSECIADCSFSFNLLQGRIYENKEKAAIESTLPMHAHILPLDADIDGESDEDIVDEDESIVNPVAKLPNSATRLMCMSFRALIFLKETHVIFKMLDIDYQRKKFIITPILRAIAMARIYDTNTAANKEELITLVSFILLPLMRASVRHSTKEHKRANIKNVEQDVRGALERFAAIDALFVKEDIEKRKRQEQGAEQTDSSISSERANELKVDIAKTQLEMSSNSAHMKTVNDECKREVRRLESELKAQEKAGNTTKVESIKEQIRICEKEAADKRVAYKNENARLTEVLKSARQELKRETNEVVSRRCDKVDNALTECIVSFTKFVQDIVMAGFTDEIRPFRPPKENLADIYAFYEHNREEIEMTELAPKDPRDPSSTSYYVDILSQLAMVFLVSAFISYQSPEKAKTLTISTFVRFFIYVPSSEDVYIYNFHQTNLLRKHPYNQWIKDTPMQTRGGWKYPLVEDFIRRINETFIDSLLITRNRIKGYDILRDLAKWCSKKVKQNLWNDRVAPSANDKQSKTIVENVIADAQSNRQTFPIEISAIDGLTIGGVNGMCRFDPETGEPKYSFNNIDCYCQGTTNIIFDEHYDKNNKYYRMVESIYNTTFPEESERIFQRRRAAGILAGIAQDNINILYGSGGEGKSVYSNSMLSMLGSESIGKTMWYGLNNPENKYNINNNGLAGVIQSRTILESSKPGTADEGGIIHAKNKRYVMVQEPSPDKKIHTAVLKEYTSNTNVSARGLYKASENFRVNALLVLQTNVPPVFDEDSDAVRRRVQMIPMRAKFYTRINEEERKNLRYAVKADTTINEYIMNDLYFTQAHFYYLLDDVKYIITHKIKNASDVPTPASIEESTRQIFASLTGLSSWLSTNVINKAKGIVPVSDIILAVDKANKKLINEHEQPIIQSKGAANQRCREIAGTVQTKYQGSVYKLKKEFYVKNTSVNRYEVPKETIELIIDCAENRGCDTAKEEYFEEYPIASIDASLRKIVPSDYYNDLFVVGKVLSDECNSDY